MSLHLVNAPNASGPVRALLVDMDGVLFDTEKRSIELIIDVVARQHLVITREFIIANMGIGPRDLLERYRQHLGAAFDAQLYWDTYWKERNAYYDRYGMSVMKGARDVLAYACGKKIPCILASSSPQREVVASLKRAGVDKYFYDVVGGDMFVHSKPQPDIYMTAARLGHAEPAACLVLEDSPNGLKSGHAAGARTAMIPDMIPYTDALRPCCNYLCDTISDVLALLDYGAYESR